MTASYYKRRQGNSINQTVIRI